MNRIVFFSLLTTGMILVSLVYSLDALRTGRKSLVSFLKRLAAVLAFFAFLGGTGYLTMLLCSYLFTPPFLAARQRNFSSIPRGLPASLLMALICGTLVVFLFRRQERLTERLAETTRRLEESERSRTQLLMELSHDVRSPITTLGLVLEGLQRNQSKAPPTELFQRTRTAMQELAYLQRLIDSLLLLAQLEDPDFGRDENTTPVFSLVKEMVDGFQDFPDRLHLEWQLKSEIAPDLLATGNRILMDRAIRNVLENASRHARTKVEVILIQSSVERVEVIVRDDGPGFSEKALRGFGRNRTLKVVDTSAPSHHSLGLGSVIVVSTIERLGGEVKIANLGNGAEVRLVFRSLTRAVRLPEQAA